MIPAVLFDNDARKLSARFAFSAVCITRWLKTVVDADVHARAVTVVALQ